MEDKKTLVAHGRR